jgi:hypothetical protein
MGESGSDFLDRSTSSPKWSCGLSICLTRFRKESFKLSMGASGRAAEVLIDAQFRLLAEKFSRV